MRLFGARIGSSCRIKPGFRLKFPWRFVVGDHCWLGESAWVDNLAPVIIGDRVCISQGVYICTGNHDFRSTTFDLKLGSIYIESDVWVASFSILCPGTHLGSSCVIFAGSVVNGVIPEGSLVRVILFHHWPALIFLDMTTSPIPSLLIVVPTLNSYQLLPSLLRSLQCQTWTNWRLLFIDGPSSKDHRKWLDTCCSLDPRCSWVPQSSSERGIFGAMNQGFIASSYLDHDFDWILFWGSDDWAASPTAFEDVFSLVYQSFESDPVSCPLPDLIVCKGRYVKIPLLTKFLSSCNVTFTSQFFSIIRSSSISFSSVLPPPHQATFFE